MLTKTNPAVACSRSIRQFTGLRPQSPRVRGSLSAPSARSSVLRCLSSTRPSPSAAAADPSTPATTVHSILDHALSHHVPRLGFTRSALVSSLSDLDLSSSALGMFPRTNYAGREGSPELVEEFWKACKQDLAGEVEADKKGFASNPKVQTVNGRVPSYSVRQWPSTGWDAMSLGERVRAVTLVRLGMTTKVGQHWADAIATMALPHNLPYAVQHLAETADEIWWLAGCRSTDLSWYLRRASLSLALSSSEIHLTQDPSLVAPSETLSSVPFSTTFDFLCGRLDELEWLKDLGEEAGKRIEFGVRSARGVVEAQTGWGRWV
ncbi:ubiquinone biosynthesis protein COQ9 [Gonapodya prolifera JEL478]|uniref:Ubiquinone biosynthesis protein n=1 Tax=Gonapodya prolifera (strain JEL478) TaxID=1344416 RepID=A0A139ADP7_GONPJ|nr:ubiquinone biosynthesis protein COQ9 [Gonapodya prolifera JEL478]|eukprot:KXS14543.1 ubiquinone biosynthesis protein COQ9 [Gonapodya prolifera JEL478]